MNDLVRSPSGALTRAFDWRHEQVMQRDRQDIERSLQLAQVPAALATARIQAGAVTAKMAMVEAAGVVNLQIALTQQTPEGAELFGQIAGAFGSYTAAEMHGLAGRS